MLRAARVVGLAATILLVSCATPAPDRSASETLGPSRAPSASGASPPATSDGDGGSAPEATWTELEDAPLARLEMATAAHDGRIWMAGGLSPLGEAVSEVEVFDPATGAWSSGPALPTGIHHAALASDGERLWLIGGYVGSSFATATPIVLTLDDGADAWAEGPPLPNPKAAGAAAWDGSRVVYAGGVGIGGVSGEVLALENGAWSEIGTMPRAREHLAATSDGAGRTWLMGGRVGGLDANLADVDVVEGTSITAAEPLPTARGGVGAFYLPQMGACLTGGEAPAEAYTIVECIDADGTPYTTTPMNVPRHGHGAAVVDGVAYVVLGGPIPTLSAHRSVERLDVGR